MVLVINCFVSAIIGGSVVLVIVSAIIGGSVVLIINCVFCFSHHRWVSGVGHKLCSVPAVIGGSLVLVINCVLFHPSSVGQRC